MLLQNFSTSTQCPQCHSQEVARVRRRGWIEKVISGLGIYPYQCSNTICNKRFFSPLR